MINDIEPHDRISFATAFGVDLLDGESLCLGLGVGTIVEACGSGVGVAIDAWPNGSNDALGLVPQTGTADDSTALLTGSTAVDTLLHTAPLPVIGVNMLLAVVDRSGFNALGLADAIPSTALPYELSVALMLHRIDILSTPRSIPLCVHTGCAR